MTRGEKRENYFFKCLQLLRMKAELEFVEKEIGENAPHDLKEEDNFFKRTFKGAQNVIYRDSKTKELNSKREKIIANLAEFERKNPSFEYKDRGDDALREQIDGHFGGEEFSVSRELLAISAVLDNEYEYVFKEEGLARISTLIYGYGETLGEMQDRLSEIYSKIAKKSLSPLQTTVMVGAGAVATALLLAVPMFSVGGVAAELGAGAVALYACLAGGAVVGATYAGLKAYNKAEAKRAFLDMDFEESARLLTVRCYLIEKSKAYLGREEMKEQLSDLLSMTDDLRADVGYELFVEKVNIPLNKDKIRLFHNFDNEMIALCGC